jgi:hypothetical protein
MFGARVKLDEDLLARCKAHAAAAGYSSVEEFIQHALETALKASRAPDDGEEKVLERLKGLGYIE